MAIFENNDFFADDQQTWLIPIVDHLTLGVRTRANSMVLVWQLIQNTGIYTLSSCVSPLLALVLAPFLAHSLVRADYGALMVMNTTIVFLTGLTQCGLGVAFFRFCNQDDYAVLPVRQDLFGTVLQLLFGLSVITVLIMLVAAPWLAIVLFHTASYAGLVRIAAIDVLAQNMTVPVFAWLRAEGRTIAFGLLLTFNVLLNLGATILFVGVWQMGSDGALLAAGCGYCGVLLWIAPVIYRYMRRRFRLSIACELLAVGLSMMPALLSIWILQLSDRYLLGLSLSLGQTASYAVAYTLGNVLGPLVITPFSLAWHTAVYIIAKQEHARDVFRLVFRWYGLFLLFAALVLSLVAHDVLIWIFPAAYTSAAAIIPLIALSNVCYGLFEVFTVGTLLQRKMSLNLVVLPLAAFLNILLNVLCIPIWGVMGAALATLVAYGVLVGCAYYINQCVYPVAFDVGVVGVALMVGAFCYSVDLWWGGHLHVESGWIPSLVLPGCYACFLVLLGWWVEKKHM